MVSETKTTEAPGLRRELKARHLTMIAIGGSIGTGLFVASGATISQAGPGGALLSYILIGLMVYFLMTSLGELAAYMPVSGSFATYGQNYVEEGFGFALGWNYWYNWAVMPNNVGGFGDVEKASRVFVRNELMPLQKRLQEFNEWLGINIIHFEKYNLINDDPQST